MNLAVMIFLSLRVFFSKLAAQASRDILSTSERERRNVATGDGGKALIVDLFLYFRKGSELQLHSGLAKYSAIIQEATRERLNRSGGNFSAGEKP